jgi:hypothetical protein
MKNNDQKLLEEAYLKVLIEQITDDWFKEGSFIAYKKPSKEPFEIAQKDGTLQTLEGPQQYKAGFYIVTGPKGEKYSMPSEKFKELKDDNGDGTAAPKKINKSVKLADSDGKVKTSWGAELEYKSGEDYIVKHGPGDYGVVKKDIFNQTYVSTNKPLEEGIWDRLKGMGSGLKAGASVVGQNLKNKAVTALGGTVTASPSATTGQAYAKAQQGSLLNSFIKKSNKEIADFKNDLSKMGITQSDADLRASGLTEIADKIKAMEDLVQFLETQKA